MGGVVSRYIASVEKGLRPSTVYSLNNHLNFHWKPLHGIPLSSLRRADIAAQLDIISAERGPHAANRARVVLSTFFSWAMGAGLAESNPVIGTNRPTIQVARDRVLSDAELVAVWKVCGDDDFGRIVRLLALTGQRRDEVAQMVWDELDLAAGVWTLPAPRSKNRRPHDIPLSAPVLDILSTQPRRVDSPFLFGRGAGPYSGFSRSKVRLDAKIKLKRPWVLHDLRRTCATGMANLGILPHVVEAVLNHVSGSRGGIAGVYNRASYATEKRAALDLWSAHIMKVTEAGDETG
ncbi:Tyrosine recombinase XerC [Methylobacterium iners]|uniref:Tyrosine recombinase XerC n=2 Tax=Methylobacterium iners TaxID=418707 RepID=A0ABQ4S0U2_9HYPH|nr:Tyrosine recombinase XerC [Methylobacterium iners]